MEKIFRDSSNTKITISQIREQNEKDRFFPYEAMTQIDSIEVGESLSFGILLTLIRVQ